VAANSLARHGRSKRAPLRLCRPQQRSGDDIHDHARREARWASRRHEHLRMLVGPKCGAHIPCGPSFDGPDCASAHDRRIAVTGLGGGGQQRGCEGPANRAGLAAFGSCCSLATQAQPPLASTARPRIPGPRVNGTQSRNLAVLRL
jgi:hypothetical protein